MDKRYRLKKHFLKNYNLKEYFEKYDKEIFNDSGKMMSFDEAFGIQSESILKNYDYSQLESLQQPTSHSIVALSDYKEISKFYEKIQVNTSSCNLNVISLRKKRNNKYIHDIKIELPKSDSSEVSANLAEKLTYLITIRVLMQFVYIKGSRRRKNVNQFAYEITLLSTNTLLDLKKHFMCSNDLGICRNMAKDLNRDCIQKPKDLFPSSFVYIDATFYNDLRFPDSIDISKNIIDWGRKNKYGPFKTASINTQLSELKPRFGYPYVYYHNGHCEHLFYFADARLVMPDESKNILNYPCYTSLKHKKMKKCFACVVKPALWFLHSSDILPIEKAYLCDFCLRSYCYVNGSPIADFQVYPYFDDCALF